MSKKNKNEISTKLKIIPLSRLNITEKTLKNERMVIDLNFFVLFIKKSTNTYAKINIGSSL